MQGYRFEQRKKQRVNRLLNIAIGLVVILIIVFAVQIFGDSSPSEEAIAEVDQEPETVQDPVDLGKENDQEQNINDDELNDDVNEELKEEDDELEPVPDGEWQPVGTDQAGGFTHDFNRSGTNWAEMTMALRYATGLDENMIIWRLENGGSDTMARGVVSDPASQDSPYEVYIEFIEGHGWTPVEKNQLSHNPYRG